LKSGCASFDVAGGSVAGRHHARAGRNCQDAFAWRVTEAGLVAAVCDGCSAGAHSEVGARLGAELLCEQVARGLDGAEPLAALVERARCGLLDHLARLVDGAAAPGARAAFVHDHLLFACVLAVVRADEFAVFHAGDGVFTINGEARALGPFPDNEPPYLGYAMLDGEDERWRFELAREGSTSAIGALALGTDGALDLVVGAGAPVAAWLAEELVFRNRDVARRRLWAWGRDHLLDDDATLVLLRRARGEG
jgi:hypothetical protein